MSKVTEEYRAERRRQIMEATARCVASQGFHQTSMADVISESGLSAGAVYGYFKGKQDLIRAISEVVVSDFASTIDRATGAEPLPSPADVLFAALEGLGTHRWLGDHAPRLAVQVWAETVRDDQIRAIMAERLASVREAWARYFRRCQEAGRLGPDADPSDVAAAAMSLMPGFVLQSVVDHPLDPKRYAAGVDGLLSMAPPP